MAYTYPTVGDFKNYFVRDFPYQPAEADVDLSKYIQNADITKAQEQADFNFNGAFASSQSKFAMLYNYLTAHYLVIDLRAASQGISGTYAWATTSKSVGSVSESYQIPDRIVNNPELMMYTKTAYGAKYLEMILPQLSGQMFIACGRTQA